MTAMADQQQLTRNAVHWLFRLGQQVLQQRFHKLHLQP